MFKRNGHLALIGILSIGSLPAPVTWAFSNAFRP